MLQMAQMLPPDWEIDYEDLGNVVGLRFRVAMPVYQPPWLFVSGPVTAMKKAAG